MSLLDGYTEEQPKQYKKKKIDEPETTSLLDGYVEPEQQPSLVDNVLQGGVDIIQSLPEATKTFGQGLALGNHRIGSGLGDVLAFAGDKYNIPTLSDYGRTVNEYWGNRANNIEMNPEYEQIKNITNPKMTLPVIANAIGSQGANMAQSLMGGVLGTAMTGGNPVGGIAGSLMPNLILEGSYLDKVREFQEKYNRIPTQEELIKIQNVSLAEKGLNSTIETVADKLLFNKFFPNNPVQQGVKELGKRIGKGIIEQGLTEGITEGMQEGVSVGAEKLLNLNDQNLKENLGRIGNSAGMGAIGGAFFGGTGGALAQQPVQTQQEQTRVNPVDYAKEVSAKVLDGGRELYNNAVNQPTAFDMMKELSNNGNYSNIRELAPNIANKQEKTNNDSLLKGFKENTEQNNDTVNKEVEQPSDTVKLSNEELLEKYQEAISKSETQNNLQVENKEKGNTNKLDVEAIAKERAELLNQDFIKNQKKYIAEQRKQGWDSNADNLEQELEEYIQKGQNQYVGQYNLDFANAIKNKDYNKLISILAQGKGSNEVSKKLFTKYTGVKLPSTIEGKKNAILEWAGKDIDEYNNELREKQNKRQEERDREIREENLKRAKSELEDINVNSSGKTMNEREFIDNLYNNGYQLEKMKQGIKPVYYLYKSNSGYKFTKPIEKIYIDDLYKNGANTYAKKNNINTVDEATKELNKYGITVSKSDTPDIMSFDGNGEMYDVSYNNETMLVRKEDLTDLDNILDEFNIEQKTTDTQETRTQQENNKTVEEIAPKTAEKQQQNTVSEDKPKEKTEQQEIIDSATEIIDKNSENKNLPIYKITKNDNF